MKLSGYGAHLALKTNLGAGTARLVVLSIRAVSSDDEQGRQQVTRPDLDETMLLV